MLHKNSLIKLGELSLAGAVLASLNMNDQAKVKALNINDKIFTNNETNTFNTNTLTHLINNKAKHITNFANFAESKASIDKLDSSKWGTLNAKDWQGHVDGNYFVLTNYTGDTNHVIVPNAADLQAAGIDTHGKQVGVTSTFMHKLYMDLHQNEGSSFAFSNTNNEKVKAIDSDWSETFGDFNSDKTGIFNNFDGSGLDTHNITNMSEMFADDDLKDVSSLKDWDTSNVTDMSYMFFYNEHLESIHGLENWNTSNVANMSSMFCGNNLNSIEPVRSWDVSNVTDMSSMFGGPAGLDNAENKISDLSPLTNWNVSNVTNMSNMFSTNWHISDLAPLKNWDVSNVTNMSNMLSYNNISDLTPLKNWDVSHVTNMEGMLIRNNISDLTPIQNWDVSHVTNMRILFCLNGIKDITPLSNWNTNNVTDMNNMFDSNPIERANFVKWNFRKMDTKDDDYIDQDLGFVPSTGLFGFVDQGDNAIINLGSNDKFPDWFMNPLFNKDSKSIYNRNIFTTSDGGHIILTSNSKLLANPNNAYNHLSFNIDGQTKNVNTPVFINDKPSNLLDNAKKIQQDEINKIKQQYPHHSIKLSANTTLGNNYDANNPIDVLNAKFDVQQQYTINIKFDDKDSNQSLDDNIVTINEPDNGGTIDYGKANDTITKLQQDGYDVSNINANRPSSLISAWNDVDKLQNVTTDAYSITNNDGKITITYNILHRHVNVTHDNPKTTNDTIEGTNKHYPTGVGQSDLNETIKVPVTYYNEDKPFSQKEILKQETASFLQTRDATVDVVTGNVNYTEWQGDRIINATAPHGFLIDGKSSWLPDIPGYTQTTTGPRFANVLQVTVPNEGLLKEIERLVGKSGMPISCTGIDTPASIAVTDNHGNNLDKYAVQTHGHYGSTVSWNGTSTPDKINSIVKQMQDDGYSVDTSNLNPDQFKDTEYSDNTKNKPLTTIVGTERLVKVTHDQPKTTNDTIDGTTKKYPAGVGQDDLNKTITRTITLKDENGKPMGKDIVQTIHMHRDATVNAVTGAITYTPWTADGSFDSVDVPKIDGYTPDKSTIEKIDKPEIGKDYNTSVVYTRNDEDASITYIDDTTGQVLKSESTKPKFGDVIKFETTPSDYIKQLENKGYELVSNDYKDGVTASQDTTKNKFTVHVKHRLSKVERNKDVHEHINYNVTDANGKASNESSGSNPVLHFKQTGVKDEVTGKTDWDGSLNSQTFSSVDVTKKPGYVADIKTVPAKTVTITNGNWDKSHDINTTVNYTPAEETVKMVVKDENGNVIQTIVKHGKFGEDYDFTNDKPKIDGYTFEKASDNIKGKFDVNNKDIVLTYKKNETKKPEKPVAPTKPSKPQRTPEDTSIFGKNIEAQKDDQGLPEMAENKSGLVATGLGIASLAGLTGLAGVQIKKRRS